jgi:hypothetical protein
MIDSSKSKIINIVLDLDQTLISGEPLSELDIKTCDTKGLKYHIMDDEYAIFERPGLQDFLRFLFKDPRIRVSVWTAASKLYATFVIRNVILQGEKDKDEVAKNPRKLDYILFLYHTEVSKAFGKGTKDLSLIKSLFKSKNYHKCNTFIIDDNEEVKETNGSNCIFVKPFEYNEYGSSPSSKKEDDAYLQNLKKQIEEKLLKV